MRELPLPVVVPVRGVSFHQDLVRSVVVGQRLFVVADPENEFDVNACAVRLGGETLGHIPRELAARLRSSGGLCWPCEVVEVLQGSKATGLRVRVLDPMGLDEGVLRSPTVQTASTSSEAGPMEPASPSPSPSPCTEKSAEERATDVVVTARSGRRLGRLIEVVEGAVEVLTDDRRVVRYPESLVELSPR